MKNDTVIGVMMKLRVKVKSFEGTLKKPRAQSDKHEAAVSLIPSLTAPFGDFELQEALGKANSDMALLDAVGLQADTLLYAEERFFSLYESAVKALPDTQLFLLLSPLTVQKTPFLQRAAKRTHLMI